MSHFYTLVLVPGDTQHQDIEAKVEELLAPYDEGMEVPEYSRVCHCVGNRAYRDVMAEVEKSIPIGPIRSRYWDYGEERTSEQWEELIAPREALLRSLIERRDDRQSPNPDCTTCRGSGAYVSTYNPKAKWDWYGIGGRWDGVATGTEVSSDDGGFNFSPDHTSLELNVITVEHLLESGAESSFAVVTPDGLWHESASMGWWAMTSNENSNWEQEYKQILEDHESCLAVGCDLHI